MKIITYNVNGVRAALKKGLLDWLRSANPDILCMQEVKAAPEQIDLDLFKALGYDHIYWYPAQKKGYSGTAVFSKIEPNCVGLGCGIAPYDDEGRIINLFFPQFTLMNVYFPSGSSGELRQAFKFQWLNDYYNYVQTFKKENPRLIICGDINICHQPIDIHNPVSNKRSSGFLPAEREWLTSFLNCGFIDAFRFFNKEPHHYTWWSNIYNSRAKNLGWRIDYFLVSENLRENLERSVILKDAVHSDHCPVLLEVNV